MHIEGSRLRDINIITARGSTEEESRGLVQEEPRKIDEIDDTIQYLVEGISSLHTDYVIRVRNFLSEYLDSPSKRVPFGGREADLNALNTWLDDIQGTPYRLLLAPAGRGKSALLVRWSQQLSVRKDLAVIFIPVSIRFGTNLAAVTFSILTARLAAFHYERVPITATPNTPAEMWRGMAFEYLRRPLPERRRLVLILDGIDEAADWEPGSYLFPQEPISHLRVVVSARNLGGQKGGADWLSRLGWDNRNLGSYSDLPKIPRSGIQEILLHMGYPLDQIVARPNIVKQLYRLSDGDPLLIKLYMDDLMERGDDVTRINVEDLPSISSGLNGYFKKWWKEQNQLWGEKRPLRERIVQSILNLMACAFGPLTSVDIKTLASSDLQMTEWDIEDALPALSRFVIGDGKVQGFSFHHPRLSDYFYYEVLDEDTRNKINRRFVDFGETTIRGLMVGSISPENASAYIVQYFSAHLRRGGQTIHDLSPLISYSWQRAWFALEKSYSGFLNDVNFVWDEIENLQYSAASSGSIIHYLGMELLCALCHASVYTMTYSIPPSLFYPLVESKIWSPHLGLFHARRVSDPRIRLDVIRNLVPHLPEPLRTEAQAEVLNAARDNNDANIMAEAIINFAPYLPSSLLDEAFPDAMGIEQPSKKVEALISLAFYAKRQLRVKAVKEASETGAKIEQHYDMLRLVEAYTAAMEIGDAHARARALLDQVRELNKVRDRPEPFRSKVVSEVLGAARRVADIRARLEILIELMIQLPKPLRADVLGKGLIPTGAVGDTIPLPELVGLLGPAEETGDKRTRALITLAPYLPESIRLETIEKAIRGAEGESGYILSEALGDQTPYLSEPLRTAVLMEALATARKVGGVLTHAQALVSLAPSLPEPLRSHELTSALTAIDGMETLDAKTKVMVGLACHLPEPRRSQIITEALTTAHDEIKDWRTRVSVLVGVAPHLPEPLRTAALTEALATVSEHEYAHGRHSTLIHLIISFPAGLINDVLIKKVRWILDIINLQSHNVIWLEQYLSGYLGSKYLKAEKPADIILHLPEQLRVDSLNHLGHIGEDDWIRAIINLLAYLPPYIQNEIYRAVTNMGNEYDRFEVLVEVIPNLDQPLQTEAFIEAIGIAKKFTNAQSRSAAILDIASTFSKLRPDERRTEALNSMIVTEVLSEVRFVYDKKLRDEALISLAPHLSEQNLIEVLSSVIDRASNDILCRILENLHHPLSKSLQASILKIIDAVKDKHDKVKMTLVLRRHLSKQERFRIHNYTLAEVFETCSAVTGIGVPDFKRELELLVELVPFLPEREKADVVARALKTLEMVHDDRDRARFMAAIAPYLSRPFFQEALKVTKKICHPFYHCTALISIIYGLPPALQISLAGNIIGLIEQIKQKVNVPMLPANLSADEACTEVIIGLAPYLSKEFTELTEEVLVAARQLSNERARVRAIVGLAAYRLDASTAVEAWMKNNGMDRDCQRRHLMFWRAKIKERLDSVSPKDIPELYAFWRGIIRSMANMNRASAFRYLGLFSDIAVTIGGRDAAYELFQAIRDVKNRWP